MFEATVSVRSRLQKLLSNSASYVNYWKVLVLFCHVAIFFFLSESWLTAINWLPSRSSIAAKDRITGIGNPSSLSTTTFRRKPGLPETLVLWPLPVHTAPKEFENGGFTLKVKRTLSNCVFCPHYAGGIRKPDNNRLYFGFVVEENSDRKITLISWRHRCRKA